jgi:coupling of ubiquitin conjugation to ER degradation protein 1
MIQVVQAMAPNLTSAQIIYDLQRTGSVELTIHRYLSKGGRLPHPPRESRTSVRSSSTYNPDNFAPNTYTGFCNSLRKFRDENRRTPPRNL